MGKLTPNRVGYHNVTSPQNIRNSSGKSLDSKYLCACTNREGVVYWSGEVENEQACLRMCRKKLTENAGSVSEMRKGATGQPVVWKNAGGTILGYTTKQVFIAVGVGVATYFLYKKFKK
jgi:hypothetical protein